MRPIEELLATIEAQARSLARRTGRPRIEQPVLDAMRATDRALFMPPGAAAWAWANAPYPIGHGQTISQPFVVALMTDLLALTPAARVLEIGTGSGYQTAVLARLAREVFSIETIGDLSHQAGTALLASGVGNVRLRVGDGAAGWPDAAPFDAILVTAAAPAVPPALLAQLAAPGRLVVPVGPQGAPQDLRLIERDEHSVLHERSVLDVSFVPLLSRPAAS